MTSIRIALFALIGLAAPAMAWAQTDAIREFASGQKTKFSTDGHPKAKGVRLSLYYPNSWTAKEGERPNIVQKFVSTRGRGVEMAVLITKSLPPDLEYSAQELREFFAPDNLKDMVPDGALFLAATSTKIETLPAGILDFVVNEQRAGMTVSMRTASLIFIEKNTMVQFQFSVGGTASTLQELEDRMTLLRPLFTLMSNSIILEDMWTGSVSERSPADDKSAEPSSVLSPGTLLALSLLITWGTGLTPPLLIRYVFLKRPLSRKSAGWIAAGFSVLFWISFLALNVAMKQKPGSGFVWVLVFFAAQWIMSNGHAPKEDLGAEAKP